ncbi:MAG: UvrD-helicase domain-containing protein [Bryobacterales bacterium]|nr:UvrD-helicase domain-containing protein [Bryobacterales bacterium]
MRLTLEQQRAVQSWQRGDICVVAGPGSGKTRVLVERLRWLIVERQVRPERILAITFTEKAAQEMHVRLVAESGPASEHRSLFEAAQISTIDAFCNRLLREHALEAGVDPGFEILDAGEAGELLAGVIERALDEAFGQGGPGLESFLAGYATGSAQFAGQDAPSIDRDLAGLIYQIRSYGDSPFTRSPRPPLRRLSSALRGLAAIRQADDLAQAADRAQACAAADARELAVTLESIGALLQLIHKRGASKQLAVEIKDNLLPACRAAAASAANEPARRWLRRLVRRALHDFRAAKRALGQLDFDDALALAARLLASDDCPRLSFEHVLIDEFQDTNSLQVRLVDSLLDAHGSQRPVRFVVGDINQSIYGFRHAVQNVFHDYRERVEQGRGDVIRLLDNFRSRPELLAAVHRLLPGGGSSGVEQHRLKAANQFPAKELPCLEVQIVCDAGPDARAQEGLQIARRLRDLQAKLAVADRPGSGARHLRWGDVAILVRTHAVGMELARALRERGIPCLASSDRGLFQAPETAELAAFLRVLRNPRDEISLAAVLKSAFCGITDADLLQIRLRFENLAEALALDSRATAGLDAAAAGRLARFGDMLARNRADRATVAPRFLLARAVAECGYRSYLARQDDGDAALWHVDQLLEWIARKEQRGISSLDAISAALDLALEARQSEDAAPEGAEGAEAVQVLTMHAAKGLEFPVVVLAALQSRPPAHLPGLLFSPDHGIGARWQHPFEGEPVADTAFAGTKADIAERERAEAERLLYVALTRAEEHLILSASYAGGAQKSGWFKTVFDRLDIDPKEVPSAETEERTAGEVRFLYSKISGEVPCEQRPAAETRDAPEVLVPLQPAAQSDYSASITSVSLFAECPRKYFLSRYLGLETENTSPRGAADPGREARQRRGREEIAPSLFGQQVHECLAGQLANPSPEVRELAERFATHDLGLRAGRAELCEREMAFVFTVGEFLLRGTVDLLFEEGGERILVDYKTDNRPSAGLQAAARQYAPQIQLYAAGLAKAHRRVDRAVVFYLCNGRPVDIDLSAPALEEAVRLVEEFFAAQRSQAYPLRAGAHCRQCPHFRRACPARGVRADGKAKAGRRKSLQALP